MLTSVTTFVGLTPMMTLSNMSTMMFVPMATSLAFGVLCATGVTLILVPCSYWILEDLRRGFVVLYGRREAASAGPEGEVA